MTYDKAQIREIYKQLPEDIKDAIDSVDTYDSIEEISKKYSLHVDQQSELSSETEYVLLGISDPMNFVSTLSQRMNIDKNIASQIVGEINDKIFFKVKESLRAIHSGQKINKQAVGEANKPDLMKEIETEKLNIPKQTIDILQGKAVEEKIKDTNIFEIQTETPQKPIGEINILEEKMKTGFSVKGESIEKESHQTIGREVDPYKEPI